MTHILNRHVKGEVRGRVLGVPYAAVTARAEKDRLQLAVMPETEPLARDATPFGDEFPAFRVLRWDAIVEALPESLRIVGPDGKTLRASGVLVMTVETFDPWHLVADVAPAVWAAARWL